jgi:hypothetical protein
MRSSTRGLTRFELALTLAFFFGLMGIVLPASARELAFGKRAIAHAQLDAIGRCMKTMMHATRPMLRNGGYGTWAGPSTASLPAGVKGVVHPLDSLAGNTMPTQLDQALQEPWEGPYWHGRMDADPWGRAFVVLPFGDPTQLCWCLSAGPNGLVETGPQDDLPGGDDIALRIY